MCRARSGAFRLHPMLLTRRFLLLAVVGVATFSASPAARAQDWVSTLTPVQPGPFPPPPPARLQYAFGWNNITAATAEIRFEKTGRLYQFAATGGTIGLAKVLWDYQAQHRASVDVETLRPLSVSEVETIRGKELRTDLTFTPARVTSERRERKTGETKNKTRTFTFPNALSLNSAFLLLRSQPLTEGSVQRVVVYPATSSYLCTTTVIGRERVTVPAGTYDALKLDVRLNKLGKARELLPHKKVKKATVWLSDDANRVALRIEAQIFIGTVFAELQSAHRETASR
jgi:hypothetical protein